MADITSKNIRDLEQHKFIDKPDSEDPNGVAVRVKATDADVVIGVDYDQVDVTFPNSTTEIYTYTLSAATVLTVQIIYVTSVKEVILQIKQL